jgi:hypothetical protein
MWAVRNHVRLNKDEKSDNLGVISQASIRNIAYTFGIGYCGEGVVPLELNFRSLCSRLELEHGVLLEIVWMTARLQLGNFRPTDVQRRLGHC